ncbi:CHAT domain-containing protein [Gloeocapsa sp. PCC 73106]|uniref:CHAT domain-containing protein n=1 Tax=Gloeocapsa sp. PCC 73106 TaxID=102232 RepID=UPI0002ABBBE0|nr:CHAT domain-containing protein [Gloeocapsa sp. PCC 73106]ELR99023.1 hypothetical protein GLO73106DRAFT_00028670 [Gloeocapsa sp. PCC 73106]
MRQKSLLYKKILLFVLSFVFVLSTRIFFLPVSVSVSSPISQSFQLVEKGTKYYQAKQFEEAAQVWQQAVDTFAAQSDQLNQAMSLSNLSLTYQQLGRWEEAKKAIAQSIALLETLEITPLQQGIFASTLDIEGQLQLSLGQPGDALNTWQQTANLYQEIGNPHKVIQSQINQAQAMQQLGFYPRACKTLLEALEINTQECQISAEQLELNGENLDISLQILALSSLGNVLRVIGQTQTSQMVLLKSWRLAEQIEDSESIAAIALSLGNTARILSKQNISTVQQHSTESVACDSINNNQTTTQFSQQAIACYRQGALATVPMTRIQSQLNLLSLLIEIQQWSEIPNLVTQIQSELKTLPKSPNAVSAQLKLAQNLICIQSQLDDQTSIVTPVLQFCNMNRTITNEVQQLQISSWQGINQLLEEALKQAQLLGHKQTQANALGYLGAIYQPMGKLTEAQQLTEQALQQISAFDNPEIAYIWQWQLGRFYQHQGNRLSAITKGGAQRAIASYELAVNILESLRRDLVVTNTDIQFNFRDSVEPVYRELVDVLLQPSDNQSQISQDNLQKARDVIESLQLAELNNFFQEACIDAQPQQIDQLDSQAAVIYSIVLPERLAVILSLPGKPLQYSETVFNSNVASNASEEIIKVFDELFTNLNPFIFSAEPLGPHQQIYNWLIRPWEEELAKSQIKTLVFVLDDILRNVPVAALHDGEEYLIEKYNVALTPSLQLLSSQPFSREKLKILVGGLAQARQGFSSLPGVKQEVKEITDIFSAKILLDQDFTSSGLQKEIEATSFPIVHLATHGQFSSQADNTFLLTWDERINVKNLDQLLRQRNGQAQNPIELLILSACQTASGDKRAVLGLAGVAVRSGARSTLASLWSVQDQSTATLMAKFYKSLSQPGVSKVEALRQAQLSLLRSPQYQHPFYWASFVLVGNWQ